MIYIAESLTDGFFPLTCTIKVKPISTSMVTQVVHRGNEPVISLVCDEDLAKGVAQCLGIDEFPTIGDEPFPNLLGFVPGDTVIILRELNALHRATWAEYSISE